MIYSCCDDERRRNAVKAHPTLNGIDFLEVRDLETDPLPLRQRTLLVHFLKDLTDGQLTEKNVRIEGGERTKNIEVTRVSIGSLTSPPISPPANAADVLVVEVSARGDFSRYTLRLVTDENDDTPPTDFDPILSSVDFSFKVGCPADFDCLTTHPCPPEDVAEPEINYLAKDYASFRQLILDRMALLAPDWKERNPADLGIALIELMAYVGDYLSYQQDAIATEAYLGTARRRTSVRRHARLVDYHMHDGRNARVWVQFIAGPGGDGLIIEKGANANTTKLLTKVAGQSNTLIAQNSRAFDEAVNQRPLFFELLHDITIFEAHNQIKFYTWESRNCCLPKGATKATLQDDLNKRLLLRAGDVLILEERKGPATGIAEDADRRHRHAVRLTKVHPEAELNVVNEQPLRSPAAAFTDPLTNVPVIEIEWSRADALPFALCVSGETAGGFADDISVALGNIALADHGRTFTDEPSTPFKVEEVVTSLVPDTVPDPDPALQPVLAAGDRCNPPEPPAPRVRYRPRLTQSPLTHAAPFKLESLTSATAALELSTNDKAQLPLPSLSLLHFLSATEIEEWTPVHDLLSSHGNSTEFVVEVEADGTTFIRFGDSILGAKPQSGVKFLAVYRIGNGEAGNIGADALAHLVSPTISDASAVLAVRNPLPATGGIAAETIEEVRQHAPSAFSVNERAVTRADWEEIVVRQELADRCGIDVQRVAATPRWTGSWHTMFLTVDRLNAAAVDTAFETKLRNCIERYRMAGEDLEIDAPQYVSLEIEIAVCIKPGYFFSDVKKELLDVFSDRVLPNNQRGVFHPDNLSFGQPVYLSTLIAAAQAVAGVDSVMVRKFQRQHIDSDDALNSGKLELGRLEIAQLSNDPNFPERGSLTITGG